MRTFLLILAAMLTYDLMKMLLGALTGIWIGNAIVVAPDDKKGK